MEFTDCFSANKIEEQLTLLEEKSEKANQELKEEYESWQNGNTKEVEEQPLTNHDFLRDLTLLRVCNVKNDPETFALLLTKHGFCCQKDSEPCYPCKPTREDSTSKWKCKDIIFTDCELGSVGELIDKNVEYGKISNEKIRKYYKDQIKESRFRLIFDDCEGGLKICTHETIERPISLCLDPHGFSRPTEVGPIYCTFGAAIKFDRKKNSWTCNNMEFKKCLELDTIDKYFSNRPKNQKSANETLKKQYDSWIKEANPDEQPVHVQLLKSDCHKGLEVCSDDKYDVFKSLRLTERGFCGYNWDTNSTNPCNCKPTKEKENIRSWKCNDLIFEECALSDKGMINKLLVQRLENDKEAHRSMYSYYERITDRDRKTVKDEDESAKGILNARDEL